MRPSDIVYSTLKRRILLNELKPEEVLTELGVAQETGCSQGTVREALMRLQDDGLVLRARHRGTTVTPLDTDVAVEMLALRKRLEMRAAQRAFLNVNETVILELERILDRMGKSAASLDAYGVIELDTEFHMIIFRLSGFRALEQILLRSILHSHRQKLWEPRHSRPLGKTVERHRRIISAMTQSGSALATELGHHIDTIVDVMPESIAS